MGYGADELYTRWAQRSLVQWKELLAATKQPLFLETGVLWLAGDDDTRLRQTSATLKRCNVAHEELDRAKLEKRYPQIGLDGVKWGLFEPNSGVLMARRGVATVVEDAVRLGAEYRCAQAINPREAGRVEHISTRNGERIAARQFGFACGPSLGKGFPGVLGSGIFPSRQEVLFFGLAGGGGESVSPALPPWLFKEDEAYGV